MTKYIRYTLAAQCFAASVGCLALWWRSTNCADTVTMPSGIVSDRDLYFQTFPGLARLVLVRTAVTKWFGHPRWHHDVMQGEPFHQLVASHAMENSGFGVDSTAVHFPIWYPALIFALAGAAALRLGRRFTIRSALIATTIVAALLGMIVVL